MRISPTAVLVVVVLAVLLFGAKRLPDAARSLGRALRVLRAEVRAPHPDAPATPQAPPSAEPAPRTIKAAPGDPGPARPVAAAEPDPAPRG